MPLGVSSTVLYHSGLHTWAHGNHYHAINKSERDSN